jgi:hypothetical protein
VVPCYVGAAIWRDSQSTSRHTALQLRHSLRTRSEGSVTGEESPAATARGGESRGVAARRCGSSGDAARGAAVAQESGPVARQRRGTARGGTATGRGPAPWQQGTDRRIGAARGAPWSAITAGRVWPGSVMRVGLPGAVARTAKQKALLRLLHRRAVLAAEPRASEFAGSGSSLDNLFSLNQRTRRRLCSGRTTRDQSEESGLRLSRIWDICSIDICSKWHEL